MMVILAVKFEVLDNSDSYRFSETKDTSEFSSRTHINSSQFFVILGICKEFARILFVLEIENYPTDKILLDALKNTLRYTFSYYTHYYFVTITKLSF